MKQVHLLLAGSIILSKGRAMKGDVVWMQAAEFPYSAATLLAMAGVEGLH